MSDEEMNNLIIEQAELQEKIDACNGWDFERGIQIAMDALRCPRPTPTLPSFRAEKNAGRPLPSAAAKARHAAVG